MKMLYIIFLMSLVLIPTISAITRENGCEAGETEMFSLYQTENSHIAQPGYFNQSICYPKIITINLTTGNCTGNQSFVLSQYKINDSHVASVEKFYDYNLCASVQCTITSGVCPRDYHIASLNKLNNSHLGNYSHYSYKLCCGSVTRTTIGGEPTEPEEIIEDEEVEIEEIMKKIAPPILLLIGVFFFIILWRRRKRKCEYCRETFRNYDEYTKHLGECKELQKIKLR